MLPSIAFVTLYCPAIIVEEATDAAYLAVILLCALVDGSAIAWVVDWRSVCQRRRREIMTRDSRDSV
jgi:hypothetical protein